MRRTSAWIGWALCLCASLAAGVRDDPEADETIPDLMSEDGTRPESGAEPAAEFLRSNKVRMTEAHLLQSVRSLLPPVPTQVSAPDNFYVVISLLYKIHSLLMKDIHLIIGHNKTVCNCKYISSRCSAAFERVLV